MLVQALSQSPLKFKIYFDHPVCQNKLSKTYNPFGDGKASLRICNTSQNEERFETISVIGLGYIGLPTAAMFASFGMKVIGVDINQDVVDSINKGIAHISEPALEDIVSKTVSNGSLRATRFSEPADAFLIAVPTPFEDGEHVIKKPNLSYLFSAVDLIAPIIKKET